MNKKYAICYNSQMNNAKSVMENLSAILKKYEVNHTCIDIDNLSTDYDFIFVIGGDGTILRTARFYSETQIPILGINLGRLGFLSQASMEDIEKTVLEVLNENYIVEKRMMLCTENHIALNDFVIKGETTRTAKFSLEINDKFICQYLADGIIISTPTGSTAYNMSAGGPIVAPNTEVIAITPICPHTFAARPLIVSSDSKIKILSCDGVDYAVSADGQTEFEMGQEITITKSDFKASLALLKQNDFYSVLRNKLYWGISPAKN